MNERERQLEQIIRKTFWMARRYANGRSTYAPAVVNQCLRDLADLGIDIDRDPSLVWDGNSDEHILDLNNEPL